MKSLFRLFVFFVFPVIIFSGVVFNDPVRVDDSITGERAHADVIMDEDLNIFSVWEDSRDGTNPNIYFSKSTDKGEIFSTNYNISKSTGVINVFPRIVMDKNHNLYVFWQRRVEGNNNWSIYFSISTDLGETFLAPSAVPGITVTNNNTSNVNLGPQQRLAVDNSSDTPTIYIVWSNTTGTGTIVELARSEDLGISFIGQTTVNTGPGVAVHPDIAVDNNGYLYIVWDRGDGINFAAKTSIYFRKSENKGVGFTTTEIKVDDGAYGSSRKRNPTVSVNDTGTIAVVWEDTRMPPAENDDSPNIYFSRSDDGGLNFLDDIHVNYFGTGSNNFRPAISYFQTDTSPLMVVAWHSDKTATNHFGIMAASYDSSENTFSASISLPNTKTGDSGANFGFQFYTPSIFKRQINDIDHFFLVWRDILQDPNGYILCVMGYVTENECPQVTEIYTPPVGGDEAWDTYDIVFDAFDPDGGYFNSIQGDTIIASISYRSELTDPYNFFDTFVITLTLPQAQPEEFTRPIDVTSIPKGEYYIDVRLWDGMCEDTATSHGKLKIRKFGDNCNDIVLYPNPVKRTNKFITFDNLPRNTLIEIYSISGELIFKFPTENPYHEWNFRSDNFKPVASGVYIAVFYAENEKRFIKFAFVK